MQIRSIIQRKQGHTVTLGGEEYAFNRGNLYTCEVSIKAHIDLFLSIPEGYEPVGDVKLTPDPAELAPKPQASVKKAAPRRRGRPPKVKST